MQKITDRELLDNYNKEIQKAEEELASLHVTERLKGLKIDREKLFAKAMRYSKYDTPLIAAAISIVMSYYEGIPYDFLLILLLTRFLQQMNLLMRQFITGYRLII